MDGNVVVTCDLFDVSPFFVSLYFTEEKWEHSIYKESLGCELVLERMIGVKVDVNLTIWRRNCIFYRYQHQYENCTYICKTCYSNGKEVVVTPKLTSSTDTSWFGLAKYAWSGYVSFILYRLLWLGKWWSNHVQQGTPWIVLLIIIPQHCS